MSQKEIDKWRKYDSDFDFFYSRVPYGGKDTFIRLYKPLFDNWYGEDIPYNTNKDKVITITSKMPKLIMERYSLKPGDTFNKPSMLLDHCKTTVSLVYWRKKGWIDYDVE